MIRTQAPGYVLVTEPDEVDALRFEQLVLDARSRLALDPEAASIELVEALGLWRGPALTEFAYQTFAQAEIRRLDELRLGAEEDRIEAELAEGRHGAVIGDLEKLTAEYPYRERMWGQLMVALYRSNRQAEALRTYQQLRTTLAEELGIEPSAEIRRLEERILMQDAALRDPGTAPATGRLRSFDLEEQLGEGVSGAVWRARQPSVGREVAIKVIRPELANRERFIHRFEAEAQLVASLEHPHIVPLFDFWRDPDGAYLVMPLLRGGSLRTAAIETWDPDQIARVVAQVGSALTYAHRRGVVHGDIHPGNVLLDEDGNAYLADFGMAARLADEAPAAPPGYVSPEQRQGGAPDPAWDVFGLGVLTYRLYTGSDPSDEGLSPDWRRDTAGLPSALVDVIDRASSPTSEERFAHVEAFLAAFREGLGADEAPVPEVRNPYKGLRPFSEVDAVDFFGRDALVGEMLDAVWQHRLVGVVGPSGSGKSSAVRAGLIRSLREGRLPGSERWLIADLYPGSDPFGELANALLEVAAEMPADLSNRLRDPDTVVDLVSEVLPDGTELLLVVDQFEELFTLATAEDTRRRFMEALRRLAISGRTRVVVTLRADFYDRPLQYEPFGHLLRGGVVSVTPPGEQELGLAITRPADQVGLEVQPELETEIIRDVTEQPGGLPLMEYALTQLFHNRVDDQLTLDAYHRTGGVMGALGGRAEQFYGTFDDAGRVAAEQVFLRLVSVDEARQDTRRRVPLPELYRLGIDRGALDDVLATYGAGRLLTFDRDPHSRTPTVEVAHEALLQKWDRLRIWIEQQREALVLHRRFTAARTEWAAADRDSAYLLSGGRLHQFEVWAASTDLALSDDEAAYLRESREHENEITAGKRRRRRVLVGVSVAGFIAIAVAAFFAMAANGDRQRAAERERIVRSGDLASAAQSNLDADAERSMLLALEAIATTRSVDGTVLRPAEEALHEAVNAARLERGVAGEWDVAFGPGDVVLVGGEQPTTVDLATGEELVTFAVSDRELSVDPSDLALDEAFTVAVSRDGDRIAFGTAAGTVSVWNAASGEKLVDLPGIEDYVTDLEFSPDGTLLAAAGATSLFVWDLESGTVRDEAETGFFWTYKLAFSPDGTSVVVAGPNSDTIAKMWDLEVRDWGPDLISSGASPFQVRYVPSGESVISAGRDGVLRSFDATTGAEQFTFFPSVGVIEALAVSPDGEHVAVGGASGDVALWALEPSGARHVMDLPGHLSTVTRAEFSEDGAFLATYSPGDRVLVWDVTPAGGREWLTFATGTDGTAGVAYSPDGTRLAVSDVEGTVTIRDGDSGEVLQRLPDAAPWIEDSESWGRMESAAFSPDGHFLATASQTGMNWDGAGSVKLWDANTGELERTLVDAPAYGVVFSADSELVAAAVCADPQMRALAWETATGAEVFRISSEEALGDCPEAIDLSLDGRLLVVQGGEPIDNIEIWDIVEGTPLATFSDQGFFQGAVAFSPDGDRLVTSGWSGTATIREATTGEEIVRMVGHNGPVECAVFSPDGAFVATCGADRTVRLWDPATGEELLILTGHDDTVSGLAFTPDGKRIATVAMDGTVRVWALDLDDLMEIAESRLTRGFTEDECRAFLQGVDCSNAE
jgi:WD40 repeat protein/serine/threonine protein kinase